MRDAGIYLQERKGKQKTFLKSQFFTRAQHSSSHKYRGSFISSNFLTYKIFSRASGKGSQERDW
jgi:hypothetical protein